MTVTVGGEALEVINTRRSSRKFSPDPVRNADLRGLLGLAMNLSLRVLWAVLGYRSSAES